jgi:hypothetical protein
MLLFQPSCTLPNSTVTFVATSNVRGTLDIVWSCLNILLLCTWSILHLNVPIEIQGAPKGHLASIKVDIYLAWRKVKWMAFVLFAPEMLLGVSLADLLSALTSEIDMKEFAAEDGVPWSLAHGFLANMGGFSIHFEELSSSTQEEVSNTNSEDLESESRSITTPKEETANAANSSLTPGVVEGHFEISDESDPPESGEVVAKFSGLKVDLEFTNTSIDQLKNPDIPIDAETSTFSFYNLTWDSNTIKKTLDSWLSLSALVQGNTALPLTMGPSTNWRRDPKNVDTITQALYWQKCSPKEFIMPSYLNLAALQGNIWVLDARQLYYARRMGLISLPNLPEDSLNDRNKGDALIKTIAVAQIAWLIVQLIIRKSRDYPSTQLEIMALAFAVCSLATYLVTLRKPQDVKVPIQIKAKRYLTSSEILTLANSGPVVWFDVILFLRWSSGRMNYWIPNTACHYVGERKWLGIRWRRFGTFWFGSALGALIVGSLHALAWNSSFPTPKEKIIWRASSILTASIPFGYVLLGNIALAFFLIGIKILSKQSKNNDTRRREPSEGTDSFFDIFEQSPSSLRMANMYYSLLSFLGILTYAFIRLFVIVEAFRSLAFLRPEVFNAI